MPHFLAFENIPKKVIFKKIQDTLLISNEDRRAPLFFEVFSKNNCNIFGYFFEKKKYFLALNEASRTPDFKDFSKIKCHILCYF